MLESTIKLTVSAEINRLRDQERITPGDVADLIVKLANRQTVNLSESPAKTEDLIALLNQAKETKTISRYDATRIIDVSMRESLRELQNSASNFDLAKMSAIPDGWAKVAQVARQIKNDLFVNP